MTYTLLSRIPDGVNPLLEIFERYITNIGNGLIIRMGNSIAKVATYLFNLYLIF